MRVLVTGGAGFIGSALVRYFVLEKEHDVLNVDALTYAGYLPSLRPVEQNPNYRFLQADICDAARMAQAIDEFQPDWIMHLAAETHVDRSITGAADFIRTNVIGTYTLLEAATEHWSKLDRSRAENFRFLHVSTDEVYGSLGTEGAFCEDTPYDPSSPYSASKAASDHLANAWHRTYGLPVIVSNCSNNYGPYQFPEKLIPLTILNALESEPLPIYGKGENVRDWLHVGDHIRALDVIIEKGRVGETYNVGGCNERRNLDVVRSICEAVDAVMPQRSPRGELIQFVPDRPGHDTRYAMDTSKLQDELGWRPTEDFETGIRKTVEWYFDNEWWWRPLRERYQGQRLGLVDTAKR